MESIINSLGKVADQIADSASKFGPETWGALAVGTVVVGYLLLRGNILK